MKQKIELTDRGRALCFDNGVFVGVDRARDAWDLEQRGEAPGVLSAAAFALLAVEVAMESVEREFPLGERGDAVIWAERAKTAIALRNEIGKRQRMS